MNGRGLAVVNGRGLTVVNGRPYCGEQASLLW
jgi:hypothetical protein